MTVSTSQNEVLYDEFGNLVGVTVKPVVFFPLGDSSAMFPNNTVKTDTSNGYILTALTQSVQAALAVRENTYTEQTVGAQRSLSSSNANDAAGTIGAQAVKITYYDSTCTNLKTETVTLTGLTPANTVNTDICFIEKMEVTIATGSSGIAGANSGLIALYTGTGGNGTIIGSIATGSNTTNYCHHYVGSGKTCYVMSFIACGKSQNTTFFLKVTDPTSSTNPLTIRGGLHQLPAGVTTSPHRVRFQIPIAVAGPARITGYVIGANASFGVYAGFEWIEK